MVVFIMLKVGFVKIDVVKYIVIEKIAPNFRYFGIKMMIANSLDCIRWVDFVLVLINHLFKRTYIFGFFLCNEIGCEM